ncbi:amp dependent CoA ligase [Lentinus tigrinus ALCF2SS1-7]|uniref:Amp dependent CoA ligase n=1 Tax=Lentinus tigrinus ALCF2SS1-6 TaxID=1328759 RepID=A0A5C2SD10_9APHY|nr:amp dependent CoA ligase [Lentinus tigrinus ALCF2SS1-6]RPD76077.1 amp dependent CoA ligase [Lentinus tigrinus ALCF2SS1-7]
MHEIQADGGPLQQIPDDLTISQFILDAHHPTRPVPTRPHPWLIEEATGREIGSDELRIRSFGLANALKIRWDIGEDDVVCLFSPNHVDYVVAIWAVHKLGGVVTTSNPAYTADELAYQLQLTKSRLIITHPEVVAVTLEAARLAGVSPDRIALFDPHPGSVHANLPDLISLGLKQQQVFTERRLKRGEGKTKLALLLFSSGTTGKPKAVMISHYSLIANLVQTGQYFRLTDDSFPSEQKRYKTGDVALGILPLFHAYGLHAVLMGCMFLRVTLVISPRFQFERMLQSIQQYRVTHLYLVPPQAVLLCKSPVVQKYDLSSVECLMCGAAPVSAELTEGLMRVFPKSVIGQGYGMTETATMISFLQLDRRIGTLGCAGILIPGMTARLVRPDGTFAGYGEPGELHLRSPALAMGYFDNPTATAETFKDGWLHTGDEVVINEDKEVFVIDRIKELIKVRGFQVAPSELEGHLFDHPDVADVCVVSIPDEYSGELPFAFVLLKEDARLRVQADPKAMTETKRVIMKHVSDHKARFKWLAGVEFVDVIPKTASGKLLRRVLRDRARSMPKRRIPALPHTKL